MLFVFPSCSSSMQKGIKKLALITLFPFLFAAEPYAQEHENFQESDREKNYYVRSKGYSSNPEPEPPHYVRQLDQTGIDAFKNIDWIDAGLTYRMRLEHRDNDYRRSVDRVDNPILSRTLAYFGIKNIIDPLRFSVEIQDSRRHNSEFERNVRDVNKLDLFQGYAELYFKEVPLVQRPVSLRAGRMAFEVLDRKLISRDDWGNTGTNFEGYRLIIGKKENNWQLDSFMLRPIIKSAEEHDRENENQQIYAAILNWRQSSDVITLQPFFLKLTQEKSSTTTKRNINSPGLRFYGTFGDVDYGVIGTYQYGESAQQTHRAYAYSAEAGYNFDQKWKPRFSVTYGFASGDKNPYDNKTQRFERFYGFNRPWSNNNTIEWENIEALKTRFEVQPVKKLRLEASYSLYWLASPSDSWRRANLQDRTGRSGEFIGRDSDFRAHYEINKNLRTTLGYAYFQPERFTKSTGRNGVSNFVYLEFIASVF